MKVRDNKRVTYYDVDKGIPIHVPRKLKLIISRISLPLLSIISRENALDLGLVPLDDERTIMALKYAKGFTLDVGCGANNFIRSYGNGIGVDVFPWEGCDKIVKNPARLPFSKNKFDTICFLASINHIPNRNEALIEANRVLKKNGQILITMITPNWGKFIHWIRYKNDPDHKDRHIDHDHELLGMSTQQITKLLDSTGFILIKRRRFVFGLNSMYVAKKRE